MLRYLAQQKQVTEYYHSNSITSLDRLIRSKRTACGIRLVEHTDEGRDELKLALKRNTIVTLCPDQQPRLRGGIFVPFFETPALTTIALPELLRECMPRLFLGYAIREGSQYKVNLDPIEFEPSESPETILLRVHKVMEAAIEAEPNQYRWSDKRFNIQPAGHKKLYR